jgi:hypothetical protein
VVPAGAGLVAAAPGGSPEAEAGHALHRRLYAIRQGRTSLLISRRLGSVPDADMIYVLAPGRDAGQGTHATLIKTGPGTTTRRRGTALCRASAQVTQVFGTHRPEILTPPEHPPACCTQQTITVPPGATAKTAQKHDCPSRAHRRSYARRTGAERGSATAKDPATNDTSCGWRRLMGLTPLMLLTTVLPVVRNQRIPLAWNARQQENARRAAAGLPPKTRRHRRKTIADLITTPPSPRARIHPARRKHLP